MHFYLFLFPVLVGTKLLFQEQKPNINTVDGLNTNPIKTHDFSQNQSKSY